MNENILDLTFWSWDLQSETEISEHLDFIADIDLDEPCYDFDLRAALDPTERTDHG